MLTRVAVGFSLCLLAACSSTSPELQLIQDAASALGGAEKLQAVSTLVIEGEGTQYNLGQDIRPGARTQTFTHKELKRAVDLANGRWRQSSARTPNFAYFQGQAAQPLLEGLDGAVAWNQSADGTASRAPESAVAERRAELVHHPLAALKAALAADAVRGRMRAQGQEDMIDVTTAAGQQFTLTFNRSTKLPSQVSTPGSHPNLGDVVLSTSFENYTDAGGFKLPAKMVTRIDDFPLLELSVASHGVGADAGDLAAPAAAASAAAITGPPPVNVTAEPVGRGVWLLGGQSHHSVLVEFADHSLLIEAPQNDARTLAVIAKARELLPTKPVTQLVVSHHHFDHTGGLRAAIAEGLTVYTNYGNVGDFETRAERAFTRNPDHLAKNPKQARVESIQTGLTLSDKQATVQLIPLTNAHSETILVVWLPNISSLVVADLFTPGRPANAFARQFLETLTPVKLTAPRQLIPLHGAPISWAQFLKEVNAQPQ